MYSMHYIIPVLFLMSYLHYIINHNIDNHAVNTIKYFTNWYGQPTKESFHIVRLIGYMVLTSHFNRLISNQKVMWSI